MKVNVQVTDPQRLKTSLIQMITNNSMSHKCVAQQVVAYENLKTKETTSWTVIPKSGRGRLRMPGAVACESFYYRV